MKQVYLLLAMTTCFAMACEKTTDVPSLHEKMEGTWKVGSYTEERYDPLNNTVSRNEVNCNGCGSMTFETRRIYVNFDTAAASAVWAYNIVNESTLKIENLNWSITKLDKEAFHLSLNQRDSSRKIREVVRYQLVRP